MALVSFLSDGSALRYNVTCLFSIKVEHVKNNVLFFHNAMGGPMDKALGLELEGPGFNPQHGLWFLCP